MVFGAHHGAGQGQNPEEQNGGRQEAAIGNAPARRALTAERAGCYDHRHRCYSAMGVTQDVSSMNCPASGASALPDPRRAYFDQQAASWDRSGPDPAATLRRLQALEDRLALRPGTDLLELGCGTGQITGWLADCVRPGRVVGADFSPAMLAQARARGVAAEFMQLDICGDQEMDRLFDRVLCFHAFPHFRDPHAALRNIARQLRAGGQLLVVHLTGSAQLNSFHRQLGGPVGGDHLPAATVWPGLLAPAGLRLLEAVDREDLFLVRAEK